MAISTSLAKFSALQPTPPRSAREKCSSRSEGADGSLGAGPSAGDRDKTDGPQGTVSWRGGHLANFAGAAHFDMDATAKSVHVGRVPVKAAGISDTACRVRLSGVPTVAAGA